MKHSLTGIILFGYVISLTHPRRVIVMKSSISSFLNDPLSTKIIAKIFIEFPSNSETNASELLAITAC